MALSDLALSIMTLPQYWDGTQLTLNLLLLPASDPTTKLSTNGPIFAGTTFSLEAIFIPSLENPPADNDPTAKTSRSQLPHPHPQPHSSPNYKPPTLQKSSRYLPSPMSSSASPSQTLIFRPQAQATPAAPISSSAKSSAVPSAQKTLASPLLRPPATSLGEASSPSPSDNQNSPQP